jgi:hypothetical protein
MENSKLFLLILFVVGSLSTSKAQNGKIVLEEIDTVDNATKLGGIVRLPDGSLALSRYQIGDFVQGGVVFYVDETGLHGLACNISDQSEGIRWYAGTIGNTQAKGDGLFAGEMNTAIIIAAQAGFGDDGDLRAARLCSELQDFAYGDWYLPSNVELNLMYQNKSLINAVAIANGGSGFASAFYWSSTEANCCFAWGQHFSDGTKGYDGKNDFDSHVRAVRAF